MQIDRRSVLTVAAALVAAPVSARAQSPDYSAAAAYSAGRRGISLLVMQGGRVVEAGSHAALLPRQGAYARLVSWQMDAVAG